MILAVRAVGGLQMIDGGEADDKLVAVLENDHLWGGVRDLSELPEVLVERLRHYFMTYKLVPGRESAVSIEAVYGHEQACTVVRAAMEDYAEEFGE